MTIVFKVGDQVEYFGNPSFPTWNGIRGVITRRDPNADFTTGVLVDFIPETTVGFDRIGHRAANFLTKYLRPYINENEVFIEGDDDDDCI